jgi:hypothetical protein
LKKKKIFLGAKTCLKRFNFGRTIFSKGEDGSVLAEKEDFW